MTTLLRLFAAALPLVVVACGTKPATPQHQPPTFSPVTVADSIAAAHGFADWAKVARLDFTFAVDVGDTNRVTRRYSWYPHSDSVVQYASAETVGYRRAGSLDSVRLAVDKQFINDSYWLLMPFYLVWSADGYESAVTYRDTMPMSGVTGTKLTVQYRPEGGYTPGDAYDLYVDDDYRLREWAYRPGGQAEAKMVMDWSDYVTDGGLVLPRDHRGEGAVRIHHPEAVVVLDQ